MTSTNESSATKKQRTKLASFRDELINEGIDAFIVGSGDPHQSEYVAESDMRRPFISDFSGSAGTALILHDKALLWTDGRYFLQASQQLSQEWTLMKSGEPGVLEMQPWLVANLKQGQTVGVDAFLISAQEAKRLKEALAVKGIILKVVTQNPVDKVWAIDGSRPEAPSNPIRIHDTMYAGATHTEKIQQVQNHLRTTGAAALVLSMLDEIVWLYNIRGSDVDYNPVVIAYAVITLTDAHLFVDLSKVPPSSAAAIHLSTAHITTHPYESIESFLSTSFASPQKVVLDPAQLNWRLYNAVATPCVLEQPSPCTLWKALKNPAEMAGIRACHIRDGAALTAFLCWLENTIANETAKVTEYDAAMMLESYRAKASPGRHMGPSFDTIAGFGSNGAIIHYKPAQDTAAVLIKDTEGSMFLLDSGGQYLDGTTDVTRTVHFGTPSAHMKRCYTAVLQGHIALATAVFPEGTIGSRIDCLARQALWSAGLDYNHGTGHGVGAFLNVHEGPQGIGFRKRENEAGFQIGMTTSNEPGYYEEGSFGIRIENVCLTVEASVDHHFNGKKYCAIETVTMTPIKTSLIDVAILTQAEKDWLNAYHVTVRTKLTPLMEQLFPEALQYLLDETKPI